ncbi:MAG: LPS-assembly protein LptD [Planctomycetota bacterium]
MAMNADGSGVALLKDASITDCTFYVPHYDFLASEVRIEIGAGEVPEVWATFWHLTPRALGLPLFYFPWMRWNARWRPLIRFRPGHSGAFGWTLQTGVGFRVKAPKPGEPEKEKRLATIWILGDAYEKRGFGMGLQGSWGWPGDTPFRGEAHLYGIHDRGDRRSVAEERGFYPLERHDRWRTFLYHRHDVPSLGARADLEINAYSDPTFLLEFYEEEWRTEKPPETYFRLLERWENHGCTFLLRPRVNDFLTRVEYLPRLQYGGISQPLPLGLGVVTPFFELSHVRLRPDNRDPSLRSERFWRFDAGAEVAAPVRISIVEVEPFLRGRYSVFGESAVGEATVDRMVASGGVRTSVQAWRDFPFRIKAWGWQKLRHVVTLQAEYLNRFCVSRPSTELIPVDELERLDCIQRINLRLMNRLSTWKQEKKGGPRALDLLFFEAEVPYYPDPDRDNGGDPFGPLTVDLRLVPYPGVRLQTFSVLDPNDWAFDRWDAGLRFAPVKAISLSISTSNVPGKLHATLVNASIRFNEKWSLTFKEMYDFERGEQAYAELRVRRILHRWVLEVGFRLDASREDVGVSVSFLPLIAVREAWR